MNKRPTTKIDIWMLQRIPTSCDDLLRHWHIAGNSLGHFRFKYELKHCTINSYMVPVKKYYNSNHGNIMSLLNNFLGGNILNTIFSNNVNKTFWSPFQTSDAPPPPPPTHTLSFTERIYHIYVVVVILRNKTWTHDQLIINKQYLIINVYKDRLSMFSVAIILWSIWYNKIPWETNSEINTS